jgi:hypothetical protein
MLHKTMNLLQRDLLSSCRAWCGALLLAVVVTGCGPGTGGTGTGPVFTFSGGAFAVSAPSLGGALCTGAGCEQAGLRLVPEENFIEFVAGCTRFLRNERWEVEANGAVVVSGLVETVGVVGAQPAQGTLRLQFSGRTADSQQVTATLQDAAGKTLVGPTTLTRGDSQVVPAPASGCVGR